MYKRSQRPTWSCTECARRKIKCDKHIPCQPCLKRGAQHLCSLDHEASTVTYGGHSSTTPVPSAMSAGSPDGSSSSHISSLVLQLQSTVRHLERRLAAVEDFTTSSSMTLSSRGGGGLVTPSPASTSRATLDSPAAVSKSEGVADAALTFEYLALGKDRTRGLVGHAPTETPPLLPTTSNILSEARREPLSREVQVALLPRKSLDYLLVFAKDVITWQHACIHTPTFQRECEAFFMLPDAERWSWTDPLWLALLFVVQSIAVHQMPPGDVAELFGSPRHAPAGMLLEAGMRCLDAGRYLSEPSFYTCQALAILCVCGHNVTDSNLLSSYLAIGIKTAQTLNLHSLGNESARVEAKVREAGGEVHDEANSWRLRIINLEMGKRVWWSFVQQDYFAIPFRGTSGVNPLHHDTPFPANVHDEELDRGELHSQYPDGDLTLVNKLRLTAMAAQIICRFFEALPHHAPRVEDHVAPFEAQLLALLPTTQPRSSNPSLKFGLALRRYINISVSHKILVLHRAFCSRQPAPYAHHQSQLRCVEMARQILDQVQSINRSSRPEGQVGAIWTISYQAVAAATVIALTLFQGNSQASQVTREEVLGAREILHGLAARSAIAERGVKMMTELINGLDQADRQPKRRGDDDDSNGQKRARVDDGPSSNAQHNPHDSFDFDWDQYPAIASVLESMPDVSKLFDGSIGNPFGAV